MRYCAPSRIDIMKYKEIEKQIREESERNWNEMCDRPTNDALLAGLCAKPAAERGPLRSYVLPFHQWLAAKVTRFALAKTSFARTSVIHQSDFDEVEPLQPVDAPILVDNWPMSADAKA